MLNTIECKENFDLKDLTTFKIGGKCCTVFIPKNEEEFLYLLKNIKDPLILGNCSNVIVSSLGVDKEVILTKKLNKYRVNNNEIEAQCGTKGAVLSNIALNSCLSGFEFLIGFPSSVGGAVFMNASCHGQQVSDFLVEVKVFDRTSQQIITIGNEKLNFGYRYSRLQDEDFILLRAKFMLKLGNREAIRSLMDRNLEFRHLRQPSLSLPNVGSIFKNPKSDSAGRLLERAKCKGLSKNGAKVWDRHANFIINENSVATSKDVIKLMLEMKRRVKDKYTIDLEPEVKFVGNMDEEDRRIWQDLVRVQE